MGAPSQAKKIERNIIRQDADTVEVALILLSDIYTADRFDSGCQPVDSYWITGAGAGKEPTADEISCDNLRIAIHLRALYFSSSEFATGQTL